MGQLLAMGDGIPILPDLPALPVYFVHHTYPSQLSYLVEKGLFRNQSAFERLVYLDWGNGAYVPFNCLAGRGAPETVALHALSVVCRVRLIRLYEAEKVAIPTQNGP